MMLNCADNENLLNNNNGGIIDENNNPNGLIELKKEDLYIVSSRNEKVNFKKSNKHKRKNRSRSRCFCNKCKHDRKSRETSKRKRKNSEYVVEEELNSKQKRKGSSSRSRSKRSRSRSRETRRRKYSEYVDSFYLSGRFRETMPRYKEIPTLLTKRNDDSYFRNTMRYPRYSFKHQGFRTNYRFYPHYYQHGSTNNELFLNSNNGESTVVADNEISLVDENQSDFFIQSSSNQEKKMNSKIIDLVDIDWSILNNKYFNSLNKINRDYETFYNPSFILSTIGTINDCLDGRVEEKIKDFISVDKILKDKNINENDCSYISSLNFIKNKNINNNSFKEIAGICMHNDIERRKSLFFHQVNKKIELKDYKDSATDSLLILVPQSSKNFLNEMERDCEFRHIKFYKQVIQLLKDDEDDYTQ